MQIFNFHHVEEIPSHLDRKTITISPNGLRLIIRTLRAVGMKIISLNELIHNPILYTDCNQTALLTFDDGYVNNALHAAPILEAEKCPATFFVLPGRLSGTNEWDQRHLPENKRDQLMSLQQMQALSHSKYITFGSHGMLHQDMTSIDAKMLEYELHESHAILATKLGKSYLPVLAYPWGKVNDKVLRVMPKSPYTFALTTKPMKWKTNTNPYLIPRFTVYQRDGNPLIFFTKLIRHKLLFA